MVAQAAKQLLETVSTPNIDGDQMNTSVEAFFDVTNDQPPEQLDPALQILSAGFSLEDPRLSGLLAMVCGALLERGASPGQASIPFLKWLEKTLNASGDEHAEQAFEHYWPSAIAFFSKDPTARISGRHLSSVLAPRLETQTGAYWIDKMLQVLHNEPVLIIEPSTNLGFIGHMSGVVDNFQLHTLLLGMFPQHQRFEAPRVTAQALEVAQGIGPQEIDVTVSGCWDLHTWTAAPLDSSISSEDRVKHWIWNEGSPMDIPVFEGHRVILLGPALYKRHWSSNRQFAHLPAEIQITKLLGAGEIQTWLHRMVAQIKPN
jgi:hypothetical protein